MNAKTLSLCLVNKSSNELLSPQNDDDQEDDLEIPAFLRRQKN